MAEITINDVAFVPQAVEQWVSEDLLKRSAILNSKAVRTGFTGIPLRGYKVAAPAWGGIAGDAQSANACLTPRGMDSTLQEMQIQRAGVALEVSGLIQPVAGTDPFGSLTQNLASFWNRQIQGDLVASITGSIAALDGSAAPLVLSGSAQNFANIAATMALYGESMQFEDLTLVVHPAVYAQLFGNEATALRPGAENERFFYYGGMQVIVDASVPVAGNDYTTYLMRTGSVVYGEADVGAKALESDRDILCDEDLVTSRKTYVIHPMGASFEGTPADLMFASRAELGDAINWDLGTSDVQRYGIRALVAPLA